MSIGGQVLPNVEAVIDGFYYGDPELRFTQYSLEPGQEGIIIGETPQLLVPEWIRDEQELTHFFDAVGNNLDTINTTLGVVEQGDDSFEFAHIASKSENPKGTMLHISTYSSSISTNPGNAFEFAVQAALYPDMHHVYVASPGNGGSSPIHNIGLEIDTPRGRMDQREYFAKSGRTTYEDGAEIKPLPYLVNMHQALAGQGLDVTGFIGTDSAGGSYATGLTLAMETDQIDYALFSERSNFAKLSRVKLAAGMIVREGIRHDKRMKKLTLNDERVVDPLSVHAPRLDVAISESKSNKTLAEEQVTKSADIQAAKGHLGALATSLNGLSKGYDSNKAASSNPLVADTNAMIARHPHGSFTFTLAEHDPLYRGKADALAVGLLEKIESDTATVRAIVLHALPHAYHTHLPLLQDALRRIAFDMPTDR